MNTKMKSDYLKFGKLLEAEHQLRIKLRALQEKRLGAGRFVCTERHHNGFVISIPLPEMVAMFPEAKNELVKWTQDDGRVIAFHRFGPEHIGQLAPGFDCWVKHETKTSEISPATQTATQAAA